MSKTVEHSQRKVDIAVPGNVGHGNLWTALAIEQQLQQFGFDVRVNSLSRTSLPAQLFHQIMTRSGGNFLGYAKHSEKIRKSPIADLYAVMASIELGLTIDKTAQAHLFVQEHPLLFMSDVFLDSFSSCRALCVPDSYPKQTAIEASKDSRTPLIVWSSFTQRELERKGVESFLAKPFFESFFREIPRSTTNEIVLKTSGSGTKEEWLQLVREVCTQLNIPYRLFLPGKIEWRSGKRNATTQYKSLNPGKDEMLAFYQHLAQYPPRMLVSYPSEIVQIVALMKQSGCSMLWYLLPIRGGHEQNNLSYAEIHNLWDGALPLQKDEFCDLLRSSPQSKRARDLDFGTIPIATLLDRDLKR